MANPADEYYDKEIQKFYAVQAMKRQEDAERVALAKKFEEMKEAHSWYYERKW